MHFQTFAMDFFDIIDREILEKTFLTCLHFHLHFGVLYLICKWYDVYNVIQIQIGSMKIYDFKTILLTLLKYFIIDYLLLILNLLPT